MAKSPNTAEWLLTIEDVEGYISVIFSFLSICCYMCIILSFLAFKKLQTMPGLCTIAFCVSLFFSDGVFVIANILHIADACIQTTLCEVIGVSMSLGLISSHLWCLITDLDISLNISSFHVARSNGNVIKKKMRRYCSITFTVSVLIVAMGVVYNMNITSQKYV